MKAVLLGNNKDKDLLKKKLNKLGTKFAEGGKKMKSLERMLRKCKGSKQLIRNLNRKLVKIIKSGHKS